jgi:hypothetical protein
MGVIDWKYFETGAGWNGNDVGHALGMFEIIGKFMSYEKIKEILPWGSHWIETTQKTEIFNILDEKNEYNAIAFGVLPWTQTGDGAMMNVEYVSDEISVYAVDNGTAIVVMMLNKMQYQVPINLLISKSVSYAYAYCGDSTDSKTFAVKNMEQTMPTVLEKLSITIVAFNK